MVESRDGHFVKAGTDDVVCETIFALPPGAMFFRSHPALTPAEDPQPRPMPHLAVMTPAGLWCTDCPASDDPTYWSRHGTPPRVTVSPSVNVNNEEWHGHLRNGALIP